MEGEMVQTFAPEQRLRGLIQARRPGWSLQQPFYTSEEVLRHDLDRVFRRYWLFGGFSLQLPHPGDYITMEIDQESIVIIRGDDGQARALYNVCRHRGSHLCTEPSGHVKKLVCPYHQWVYERDGRLAAARLMPDDFDRSAFGLHTAHLREVEGLIFVCLADEPPSFAAAERAYAPYLKPYALTRTKIAHYERYPLQANWKLLTENFRECYHCGSGHPEYCRAMIGASLTEPREAARAVREERMASWKAQGLPTEAVHFSPERWYHVSRYPFRPGFVTQSLDGRPVGLLLGELPGWDAGTWAIVNYPGFWLESGPDVVWCMRATPVTPTLTWLDQWWLVREDAAAGKDYDVERVTAFWHATGGQDWKLCEANQAGINSRRYAPGPYAPSESEVEVFIQWYLRSLAE
jgi:glycine betaine catabolism A